MSTFLADRRVSFLAYTVFLDLDPSFRALSLILFLAAHQSGVRRRSPTSAMRVGS